MKKRFVFATPFVLLLLLQLWRPDLSLSEADPALSFYEHVETPQPIRTIFERSCADCHSNVTRWPWYAHVAPVGQWLREHVDDASRHFSLANYGEYPRRRQRKIFHELAHEIETEKMPLPSYLWLHYDAALEDSERILLVNWAKRMAAEMEAELPGNEEED